MTEEIEVKNAVITAARLTKEERNLLDCWLTLDYGGGGQGFGGYALYLPDSFTHSKGQANFAGHFIFRVLQIAGVDRWDQLIGKTIRARASFGKVHEIGHIVKNDWFNPSRDFEEMRKAANAVKVQRTKEDQK